MVAEVLRNEARFGQDDRRGVFGRRRRDGEDRSLAEGVNLGECGGREGGGVAVEELDIVREIEFLEEPDYALSAGLVEPVECDFGLRLRFGGHCSFR